MDARRTFARLCDLLKVIGIVDRIGLNVKAARRGE
jgi:hypothetical protein